MVYSLSYRRPEQVPPPSRRSMSGSEKTKSISDSLISDTTVSSHGIPDALSFDRIIAGGTCPPVTVRDFMDFLKYVEHSAENLQFYLWFKDYVQRFENLPESERAFSPEWTKAQEEAEASNYRRERKQKPLAAEANEILKSQELEPAPVSSHSEKHDPFGDSQDESGGKSSLESAETPRPTTATTGIAGTFKSGKTNYSKDAESAFQDAGVKLQPFTIQPFREEMSRIITIYIADGAPRQLNLSARERTSLLHALEATTHPSAFRSIIKTVEWSLRRQAHPNFIRWSICNGNRSRVIFARGLGISLILIGIITGILITISSAGRGWRVMALIPFMIGISTLIAAWKGMCVVLHGMHHRHLRPWELFEDEEFPRYSEEGMKNISMETVSSSKNSYEDEPWVAQYGKRNIIRKIFDRETWIEEPALRQIQDTIFIQSLLGAVVVSAILVGIFCAVPHGDLL